MPGARRETRRRSRRAAAPIPTRRAARERQSSAPNAGSGEKARIERRYAHHHRRARQEAADLLGVEFREPEHARARQERAVAGDEEAVHVIDRKRMQEDVAAREAPMLHQRERVAREVAVGQHRAFGPARRSRRVEDRRDVVGLRYDRVERRRPVVGPVEQRPLAALEGQHLRFGAQRRGALGELGPQTMTDGSASPNRYASSLL